MKTKRIPRNFTLTLALFAVACLPLSAQQMTESLQKFIWPGTSPLAQTYWESITPPIGQDTVFDWSTNTAEAIVSDADGYPASATLLHFQNGNWIPETRTEAQFDALGNLIQLQSFTWASGIWKIESLTDCTRDFQGNALSFHVWIWEEGSWTSQYAWGSPEFANPLTAELAP